MRFKEGLKSCLPVVLCGILLAGCVETPREDSVVDRSEGFPKEKVLKKSSENKDFGTLDLWQEQFETDNKQVSVHADVIIETPQIRNTPVYELTRINFEDKELKQLVDYFSKGKQLYKYPKMTKDELKEAADMIENQEGSFGRDGRYQYTGKFLQNMEPLIDSAPEKRELEKINHVKFGKYQPTELEITEGGEPPEEFLKFEDYFRGYMGTVSRDIKISAVQGTDKNDRGGEFSYVVGTVYSQSDLERDTDQLESFKRDSKDSFILEYGTYLENTASSFEESPGISEERAKELGSKALQDLNINDNFELKKIEKAICYDKDREWNPYDSRQKPDGLGYTLTYAYPYEGVPVFTYPEHVNKYKDLGELVYAPSFEAEILKISVTDEGIRMFTWSDMAEKTAVITENSKLLPFDQIQESLKKHLMAVKVSIDNINGFNPEEHQSSAEVKEVNFCVSHMNAYKNPKAAWLVPVWVFKVETNSHSSVYNTDVNLGTEYVVLNAYDGGYIAPK